MVVHAEDDQAIFGGACSSTSSKSLLRSPSGSMGLGEKLAVMNSQPNVEPPPSKEDDKKASQARCSAFSLDT